MSTLVATHRHIHDLCCVHAYIYVYVYTYVYIYIYVCMHMYICMYIPRDSPTHHARKHSFATVLGNSFAVCQGHWLIYLQYVLFICNVSHSFATCKVFRVQYGRDIYLQHISFVCNMSKKFVCSMSGTLSHSCAVRPIHLQYVSFICNTSRKIVCSLSETLVHSCAMCHIYLQYVTNPPWNATFCK